MYPNLPRLLLLITAASAALGPIQPPQDHLPLLEMLLYVTPRYISSRINTLVFNWRCADCTDAQQQFQLRLAQDFIIRLGAPLALELCFRPGCGKERNYYIFLINNLEAYWQFGSEKPAYVQEHEVFGLVVLTSNSEPQWLRERSMVAIVNHLTSADIMNGVVAYEDPQPQAGVQLYTFVPSDQRCSMQERIEKCNHFQNGRLQHDYLFPLRLRNFQGCTFNVSAHNIYPFFYFAGDRTNLTQLRDKNQLRGIEGEMFRILADTLNFTWQLNFPEERSELYSTGANTGSFGQLERQEASMAVGGFDGAHEHHHRFTISLPLQQSPYVFVLRTGQNFGPLRQLFEPFSTTTWLALLLTLGLTLALINFCSPACGALLRQLFPNATTAHAGLDLLALLLGHGLPQPPKRQLARVLLLSWLLATLVLRHAYQGKMYDSLRMARRVPTPHNFKELLEQRYILLAPKYVNFYPRNMTLIMPNGLHRLNFLSETKQRFASLTMMASIAHYNRLMRKNHYLTYVDEPIMTKQLVIYFRKHSVLKFVFDHKIGQLTSSGISAHIMARYDLHMYRSKSVGLQPDYIISNRQLRGLYMVYGLMLTLALIKFLLELFSQRVERLKRLEDVLHYKQHN